MSKENQKWFSRWWRGGCFLFWSNGFALRAGQRQGGGFRIPPPYLWIPLSPQRVKGYSPLTIPKKKSKPKNASRFAKRIFLCFSHLRLRRGCYVLAGLHVQQGCKVCCEAANRRKAKMRLRDLHAEWRESPAFLLGAHFFGIVKGEKPLTRCGESGVQR